MLPQTETTLSQLEEKIRTAALSAPQREELLGLTGTLRNETRPLAESDRETAESIAGFAHAATHEALRQKNNPKLRKLAEEALRSSVEEFEQTHPRLVETVSGLCRILANIGI